MQIAIVDDRAELSESCRPGQFSACLYGHLYGEHGWNGGNCMIIKRTQQKRFPVFCLICCLTCLFCFIGSISAFAFQTATPSDADKIRITKIQNEDELLALPDFTLPLKSSPSDDDMEPIYLFALKYQTVSATVIENNESRSERFSVCWDFSAIDQTTLNVPLSQKVNV